LFFRSTRNNSSDPIIITDNSIVICLALTALLIAAGLILARTAILGEAGSLYADSIQPQAFRLIIDTQPAPKRESVLAAAGLKAEAPKPAALSGPLLPAPEAGKATSEIPIVPKEKTAAAALAKAGDSSQTDSQPLPEAPVQTTVLPGNILTTMRGGRHPAFASIVFQASTKIDYDRPRIQECSIRFKLKNTTSRLNSFRRYKTFDSWARLEKTGEDIDVEIGLLPGLIRFSSFLMEDPHRLVINLYDKDE
jgi:hypothetical protein